MQAGGHRTPAKRDIGIPVCDSSHRTVADWSVVPLLISLVVQMTRRDLTGRSRVIRRTRTGLGRARGPCPSRVILLSLLRSCFTNEI